jgi:quercetin dioxygenase-like cupin family protein
MADAKRVLGPRDGTTYDWANDTVRILSPQTLTSGRVTVVEDSLKPGFRLDRHHHREMTEIFHILDGEVVFEFDDETVTATAGTTVNVSAGEHHAVSCADGARLLTIFTPGGFDSYLAEIAEMVTASRDDPEAMTALGERYDIWPDA